MRQKRSIRGGNVLLQRVRRYASMPTLYRAPDPAASDLPRGMTVGPRPTTDSASSSPLVVARLFLPSSGEEQQIAKPAPRAPDAIARAPMAPVSGPTAQPAPPPEANIAPQSQPPETGESVPGKPVGPVAVPETSSPQTPTEADDSWDWMDDDEWNRLKSFMTGHQKKAAEERARQAEFQRSPEEIQRAEARKRAEAELARRQELARKGQLPRAKVVYLSPEEKAAGAASMPDAPGSGQRKTEVEQVQTAPAPDASEERTQPTTPQLAGEAEPEPTIAEEPLPQDQPAAASESPTISQVEPPEASAGLSSDQPPGVAQRLLNAARSLFRRPDDDETPPAPTQAESEAAPRDLPEAPAASPAPEKSLSRTPPAQREQATESPFEESPTGPEMSAKSEADTLRAGPQADRLETAPLEPGQGRALPSDAPSFEPEPEQISDSRRWAPETQPPLTQAETPQSGSVQRDLTEPSTPTGDEGQTVSKSAAVDSAAFEDDQDTIVAPVPLQQAWPVEEKPAPAKTPGRPATESKPGKPALQRKAAGGDDVGEEVHFTLRDVAPAQATDSSIELVTPRRPRPTAPAPDVGQQEEQRPVTPPEDHLTLAPAKPTPPTRQRPDQAHMVPTEIGQLPSDLWHLLGEKPPSPQARPTAAPEVAAPIQREVTAATLPAETEAPPDSRAGLREPGRLLTQQFAPPVLQRVESESRTAGDAAEGVTEEATEQDEAEDGAEIDIEALARKVLPEIKRRLAIDWERGRGRIR